MAYTTFRKFVNQRFPLIKFKNESFDVSIKRSALKNKIQSGKDGVPLPTNLTQTAAKKSDTHLGSVSLKSWTSLVLNPVNDINPGVATE